MSYNEKPTNEESAIRFATLPLEKLKNAINQFDHWFNGLPDEIKAKLQELHDAAMDNLIDAKADISATLAEYLVCAASDLAKKEERK